VEVRADSAIPPIVFDPDQMTQVLWNIALNGVEAMERGGRLSLEVGRRNSAVAIAIADTGRGIPPDERGRVFEPFYSRKRAGSGLGLTIAGHIVSAHGGRIDVDSTPGCGTRFTIVLPAAKE